MKSLPKNICFLPEFDEEFSIELIKEEETFYIEIFNINKFYDDTFNFDSYYDIIHATFSNKLLTFYGCVSKTRNRTKAKFEVEGYYEGAHLKNLDDILVKSFTFCIPDSVLILFEKDIREFSKFEDRKESFIIDNLELKYKSCVIKDIPIESYSTREFVSHSFSFLYEKEVKLAEVFNHLNVFKQFLNFSIGCDVALFRDN